MAIIELAEVKTLLGITDTAKDSYITAMIPIVEDFVKRYCNDDFLAEDGVTSAFPAGIKLPVVQLIKASMVYKGVAGESIGDYSVSFFSTIPQSILIGLKPYKKLKFV
jgi:hypothetical protein